jgi:Tol biopolymer transport system component
VNVAGGLHWGDDGNIVFSYAGGRGLYRMPATGGDPEPLLDPGTSVRNPRLLPGGRAVIFTDVDAVSTLILDLETDSVRVLRAGAIDAMYVETGHLLYTDVSGTLWAAAFDARRAEIVGEPVTLLDGVSRPGFFSARFAVSDNGTLVYSSGIMGAMIGGLNAQRLAVVDLEGNEEVLVLSERHFGDLKWSPDGRSIVYESIPEGESDAHIYTYDVELGATPRQLTFEGSNISPVYSPDGTRVVFSSLRDGTDAGDLFVKRLSDDTPAELLITLPGYQRPTQWPSDTLVVFVTGPPPDDLWMLDLSDSDSPRAVAYLEQEAQVSDIVVSPDGALAAYLSRETGTTEIYVRSFPEPGERTRVSEGGADSPVWSPDGNTLYYWTLAGAGGGPGDEFMAARIQRNPTPVVLSRELLFTGNYFRPASDLHPDGDRVIVAQNAGAEPERFLVVTNWFEELRERMGN